LWAGLLCCITVFVFLMVPETKGVSLEKMDRIFAVRTWRQFVQYMRHNARHCFAVLFIVKDYDEQTIDAQREANYAENKARDDAQSRQVWTAANVPQGKPVPSQA
jgi:hypothetical protein